MVNITRANVDELLDRHAIQVLMKSGRWWTIRRNGATKRWKRDPNRIKVPFKYGMYGYGAITESDFDVLGHLDPVNYRVEPTDHVEVRHG